jgi:hypothetical protein
MIDDNLKQLSLDELLGLLATAQGNLALSRLYNHGAVVINKIKNNWKSAESYR